MHTSRKTVWLLMTIVGLAVAYGTHRFAQLMRDPNVILLLPEDQAEWIGVNEPFVFTNRPAGTVIASFRKKWHVSLVPDQAILTLRTLKSAAVYLDGQLILGPQKNLADWKSARQVDLTDRLSSGVHELKVTVLNENGPVALLAYCPSLQLVTNSEWEASSDEIVWSAARSLANPQLLAFSRLFPRADQAFVAQLSVLVPIFVVVFLLSLVLQRSVPQSRLVRFVASASGMRWLLVAAWAVLAANNFSKIPAIVGFDVPQHMEYIRYVATRGRVPLATEGWQMFQSPFYYLLMAPLYKLLSAFLPHQTVWVWRLLRLVSLACGGLQTELCYRTLKHVCPGREDLQKLGTILGGLLPMNIYVSQVVGNEPLAGCLSAVVVMLGIKSLCVPEAALGKWHLRLLGIFLGLAVLTKVTAVMLIPLVGIVVIYCFARAGQGLKRTAVGCVTVFGIAMVISGWFYLRNWIELGRPFVGGWDPSRGIVWWQDPGYRVPKHFFGFGQSLEFPVYSGVCGLWDALFSSIWLDGWLSSVCVYGLRPPWNYTAMISGAWLAILPTVGLAIGSGSAVCCPRRVAVGGLRFAVACIATYILALIFLYLQLPIYSTAKATYTLGLIPCYAAVGAIGLSFLMRGPLSRAAVYAWMVCWAVSAYMAYFVL